jgi:hypothetical protein
MITQLGLLLGPGINFGLKHFNFHVYGSLYMNELTAPGYVMAFLMLFGGILVLFLFKEPPPADVTAYSDLNQTEKAVLKNRYREFVSIGTFTG